MVDIIPIRYYSSDQFISSKTGTNVNHLKYRYSAYNMSDWDDLSQEFVEIIDDIDYAIAILSSVFNYYTIPYWIIVVSAIVAVVLFMQQCIRYEAPYFNLKYISNR